MHDGMLYDPIQGESRGHECLKVAQEELTISPTQDLFLLLLLCLLVFKAKVSASFQLCEGPRSMFGEHRLYCVFDVTYSLCAGDV